MLDVDDIKEGVYISTHQLCLAQLSPSTTMAGQLDVTVASKILA